MTYQFLTTQREGPVEYLFLNRPDVRNAFNEHVIEELSRWAETTANDKTVRCAVLGGAGLAAVCDIAVCEDEAIFGFTEVKLGILPAVIAPYAVAKIGRSAARELFLTGARFSAARAREIGLVHTVAPEPSLDAAVDEYLREIRSAGPAAVAAAKQMIA